MIAFWLRPEHMRVMLHEWNEELKLIALWGVGEDGYVMPYDDNGVAVSGPMFRMVPVGQTLVDSRDICEEL